MFRRTRVGEWYRVIPTASRSHWARCDRHCDRHCDKLMPAAAHCRQRDKPLLALRQHSKYERLQCPSCLRFGMKLWVLAEQCVAHNLFQLRMRCALGCGFARPAPKQLNVSDAQEGRGDTAGDRGGLALHDIRVLRLARLCPTQGQKKAAKSLVLYRPAFHTVAATAEQLARSTLNLEPLTRP